MPAETEGPVLVSREPRERGRSTRPTAALVLAIFGVAFAVVGLVDLVLLWIPTRLDTVAWEFATVGRTLEGLPMPLLGLGLLTYGLARHPKWGLSRVRGMGIAFAVLAVPVAALGVLLLTSAPAVLSQTPPGAVAGVRRAVILHAVQAVVYLLTLVAVAVALIRGSSPRNP